MSDKKEELSWHSFPKTRVFDLLNSSDEGLSVKDAERRLEKFGYNEIEKKNKIKIFELFFRQFKSFLIIILIIAAIFSLIVGEFVEAVVISLILMGNASLGFFQEYKAEKAIEALRKMSSPKAIVLRDGKRKEILTKDVVPGDVVYLREGKKVPADLYLFDTTDLKIDESLLTGESVPVSKESTVSKKELQIADIKNMAFSGTYVSNGEGMGIVVRTGMNTEIGRIAGLVEKTEREETPLKKKIDTLGKNLGLIAICIVAIVFFLNLYLHTRTPMELFVLAIAMAVSAVPEGLPIVVTLALAFGVQAMAKKNAIIRKLMAVETLGSTTVICTDKTGTLTKNEMTVQKIFTDNKFIKVTGTGYQPNGDFFIDDKKIKPLEIKPFKKLIEAAALCNTSDIVEERGWNVVGSPTEGALVTLAKKANFEYGKTRKKMQFKKIPFSSERKMMAVAYKNKDKIISYVKGAPERILSNSTHIIEDGKIKKLTNLRRKKIQKISNDMAGEPLRVLGLAFKKIPKKENIGVNDLEENLIFIGLVGMVDPPRENVKESIEIARQAGIKTVMVTGDHKITAVAIAKQIGLMDDGKMVVTGKELEAMSIKELEEIVDNVAVFSRLSPEHKVKITQAFEAKGHVVAMTGDGVNDAPALKRAHIGVSMGMKGTDVAKQASDMVLEDDNYSTIISAVKGGRRIYDNIKKFVRLQLSSNFSEIGVISFAAIAGLPLPLLPLQILWINFVTSTLPATALAIDPAEEDIMKRKPREKDENIIRSLLPFFLTIVTLMCFVVIFAFLWSLQFGIEKARTIVFTTIVVFILLLVFNCRSETKSVLKSKPFSNKYLLLGVTSSFLLQIAVIYTPFFQNIFQTVPLGIYDWIMISIFGATALLISPKIFNKVKL